MVVALAESEILKKYVANGDVVGICVSGGLDSKTVALRLRLAGVKVKCFTADIAQPDEDDINDIPKKMAPCGVETIVVDLKDEIAEILEAHLQFSQHELQQAASIGFRRWSSRFLSRSCSPRRP